MANLLNLRHIIISRLNSDAIFYSLRDINEIGLIGQLYS